MVKKRDKLQENERITFGLDPFGPTKIRRKKRNDEFDAEFKY